MALSSSLRTAKKHKVASAIDTVMSNQDCGAIPKIPKFVENADFKPEPVNLDECSAIVLHYNFLVCSSEWAEI